MIRTRKKSMEYKKDNELSLSSTSDTDESKCDTCLRDKITTKATAFCCECHEMLCVECQKHHRRNKYTLSHKLCEIKTTFDTSRLGYLTAIEKCQNHPKEVVKYLCKDHDQVCCNECAVVTHRCCSTLVSVASQTKTSTSILVPFVENMHKIDKQADILRQHEVDHIAVVTNSEKAVKKELETLKNEILEAFIKLETRILDSASENRKSIVKSIEENIKALDKLKVSVKESRENVTAVQEFGQQQHIFLAERDMKKQMQTQVSKLQQLLYNTTVKTVVLNGVDDIRKELQRKLFSSVKVSTHKLEIPAGIWSPEMQRLKDSGYKYPH